MTPRPATSQMPFEFGVPIDPTYCKVLQQRIHKLLSTEIEGFPGSYPTLFEPAHLQLLANEEYFVTEKVTGIRHMLLSTQTPKGPACFLIDRHYQISFVPNLLLPLRESPTKCHIDTILDGELVSEGDGSKKTLRFLVFDLMVLNGLSVTQRSYSTRLGMMDQDILGVQAAKLSEVKAKEPFTIERKTMQRSYGLNIILAGSKRHKHGGEGLIFAPVKQAYIPGISPKLLKWKSHTTAQFQIKVTFSKERKPLYCIHVRQGTGTKFYDYVTPEPALASEWHTSSPDGKNAEFWWDAQWPTQMFEKGYGLETRQGGWRYYRTREDKKDIDDEATLQTIVKSLDHMVTKEQLESQIDHIRTQWKAREAGGAANGKETNSSQRPSMKPLTINNNISHAENHPPLMTPSLSSTYLQSPSVAGHSGSHGYFSKRDRERKPSMDDQSSSGSSAGSITGTFSHPLPPKPQPFRMRQTSTDQPNQLSPSSSSSPLKNSDVERNTIDPSLGASAGAASEDIKPTGTSTTPVATTASTTTPTSTSPAQSTSTTTVKNPHKLSQVQAHLQPIKSWMTALPSPRAPPIEKPVKALSEPSIRGGSTSRKSSMSGSGLSKEIPIPAVLKAGIVASPSRSSSPNRKSSLSQEDLPQTPIPARANSATPQPSSVIAVPILPALSLPRTSLALPDLVENAEDAEETKTDVEQDEQAVMTGEMKSPNTLSRSIPASDGTPKPSPILGKRTVGGSPTTEGPPTDSLARRRKLSDGFHPSPKTEAVVSRLDTLHLVNTPTTSQPAELSASSIPSNSQHAVRLDSGGETHNSLDTKLAVHGNHVDPYPAKIEEIYSGAESGALRPLESRSDVEDGAHTEARPNSILQDTVVNMHLDTKSEPKLDLPVPMYDQPTDHEKQQALARARALASSKVQQELESRLAKEKKRLEDIENFKEKSRVRTEKAQKRKIQEAMETQVQDRRAQPVRQINQQQQLQRSMSSPQEQQRMTYVTRQSRAGTRPETNSSGQNSPRPHGRLVQSAVKEQRNSPRLSVSEPQAETNAQSVKRESGSVQDDRNEGSPPKALALDQQGSQLLLPEEAPRYHRRINSVDYQRQTAEPLGSIRRDSNQSSSGQGSFEESRTSGQQADGRPPHTGPNGASVPQYSADNDGNYSPSQSEGSRNGTPGRPIPAKRESKARLQFILNNDSPSPESSHGDDMIERPSISEAPAWYQQHPESERRLWTDGPVPHGQQPSDLEEYTPHDRSASAHERFPSIAMEADPGRRLPLRTSTLIPAAPRNVERSAYSTMPESYEYPGRHTQGDMAPMALVNERQTAKAPPPPERWHVQHLQQSQGHASTHPGQQVPMAQTHNPARRVPQDGPSTQSQQPPLSSRESMQGLDQAPYGHASPRAPSSVDHQGVPANGPGLVSKRPQKISHSRHSSLSKSGPMNEAMVQGSLYQTPRPVFAPGSTHSAPVQADYYAQSASMMNMNQPSARSGPPPHDVAPPARFQQPLHHPQQHPMQQQGNLNAGSRKKVALDPQAGHELSQQPGPGPQMAYDRQPRAAHPQQYHPQQQGSQHMHSHRHSSHIESGGHGYEAEQEHGVVHRHPASAHPQLGYYEHEPQTPPGPSRPVMYGSHAPHPGQERHAPGYPAHHASTPSHDFAYHAPPVSHTRGEPTHKGDGRLAHGGRSSNSHIPADHQMQQQQQGQRSYPPHNQAQAPPPQQQQHHQQQPQQQHQHSHQTQQTHLHHEYRQGQTAYRPYPPQMQQHMQQHPLPQNGSHPKVSSPRHGHPGDYDPAYRPHAPHPPPRPSHGHGGPAW
ncbi:hypothetical protein EMPS_05965 [Entomortierella parvispora]|uniref:mRNA capping enzyme adenylation domain-containing protein n=1 Tax=Entomortierella parvispora TaxID=205924 RepID=A0A9P3HC40_9FUNG|nr:hypothetical protein EMPS_05965 [Entomortierella parvispora]